LNASVDRTSLNASPPETADPKEVAAVLHTTEQGLAQMRYRGMGPNFIKVNRKVLYRWSDVNAYLDAHTVQRTGDPRRVASAGA
jgi:hypothetical protein